MESEGGKIYYGLGLDNKQLQEDARRAVAEIQSIGNKAEAEGARIDNAFKQAASSIGLSLAGISVGGFLQKMFQVRSEFQDTESSMRVFLGSTEKAADFMKKLQDYAWYNMFEFSDLTKESAKLLAFGNDVDSVIPILDKLSNIAAGTKQPLSEFVDLYDKAKNVGKIDAMGLQSWATKGVVITKVLKEMGVEVDSSAIKFEHLEMVLNKLTSSGGMFHGLMEEQMQNLSASFGQLQDDISIMFNELGQKAEGTMKGLIDSADWVVKNYEKVGKTILDIAVAYGAYRAAIMAVVAVQKVSASVQYATELAELSKLLPLKEQSAFADIQAAVASGKLTQAKAEQLIAVKLEVQAKLEELQANQALAVSELTTANTARKAAVEKAVAIRASIAAKQTEIQQAILSGNAQKVETLQKELSTLSQQKDTIAVELNTASKARASAQSKVKSTTTAVETMTTNINTAGTVANANAQNILSVAKIKLTAITAKLNAVIMANPYMLAAAAIAALAFGIYKLITAETAAESAQRKHNEALEAAKEKKNALISKTNELISKITDETQTIYTQIKAWKELQEAMPEAFANMTFGEFKAMKPEDRQKLINKAAESKELADFNKQFDEAEKRVESLKKSLIDLQNPLSSLKYGIGGKTTITYGISEQLKEAQEILRIKEEEKKKQAEIAEQARFQGLSDEAKKKELQEQLDLLKRQKEELEKQIPESYRIADANKSSVTPSIEDTKKAIFNANAEWNNMPFKVQSAINQVNFLNGKIVETTNLLKDATGIPTNKNKTYWEGKKKEAEDARNALDSSKENSKEWKKYSSEIAEAQKEIDKYSNKTSSRGGSDDTQKRLDALKRLNEIEKEQAIEMERFRIDMAQREIDLMDDSYEKRRIQLELNLEKEYRAIEEFKQKKVKEQQDIEKEQWTAKGSKGAFTPSTVSFDQLNNDVKLQAKQLTQAATDAYSNGLENIERDSIKALEEENLRLASGLTKQLANIRQNYAERIKAAKGNAALIKALEENQEKEISNTYSDYKIKSLEFDRDIAIRKMQLSKNTYTWEADYQKAILEIQKEAAEKILAELEEIYKNTPTDEIAGDIEEIKLQIDELNQSLDEMPVKKFDEMQAGLKKISSALGGLDGEIGEIFSSLGNAFDSVSEQMKQAKSGTTDYAGSIATAIQAIVNIINMVASANSKRKQAEREYYQNAIALAHEYALALNETLRTQSEGAGFITDYAGQINDSFAAMSDAADNYYKALDKLSEGKAKTGLKNEIDWGNVAKGAGQGAVAGAVIGSVIPVIGTAVGAVVGGIVGGLVGLFAGKKKNSEWGGLLEVFPELVDSTGKINKELAQTLIDTKQLDDKTKQLVENALEWADAVEAANEKIKGIVTDLAGDLGNNLKKSIVDAWKAGEDASKNMFDAASKSLEGFVEDLLYSTIFSDVFKQFQQDLVDSLNPVIGDGDIVDDYERLMDSMNQLDDFYVALLDSVKNRAAEKGFDMWKDETGKNKKGVTGELQQQMTEGTASQLVGLWNMTAIDIRAIKELIQEYQFPDIRGYLISVLGILNAINVNTRDTADNTDGIKEQFDEMNETLGNIEKNTKQNNSRG